MCSRLSPIQRLLQNVTTPGRLVSPLKLISPLPLLQQFESVPCRLSTCGLPTGLWEKNELHTVLTALERAAAADPDAPTPALLDIGANIGTYSLVAAAFGYTVRAFEAMPRNAQAIYQTLCWNPQLRERLTLFPYALGEEEAACAVMSIPGNVANGNLVCTDEQLAQHQDMVVRGATHTVRLGEYLGGVRSDVMKIDVEGFEPMVLRGAGALPALLSALI